MKYRKLLVGFVFLLTACVTEPTPPPGTLDKEAMVAILSEIHVAEAKAQQAGFRTTDSSQLYYKSLEMQVLKKYKTDSIQYHNSYKFYSQNIKQMNEIYKAIVDTLESRHRGLKEQPDTSHAPQKKPSPKADLIIRKKNLKKMF